MRYTLNTSSQTWLGSLGCTITLPYVGVAPQHARIIPYRTQFMIEAVGGSVAVNGFPHTGKAVLNSGDYIVLGSVAFVFEPGALIFQGGTAIQPAAPIIPHPATTGAVQPASGVPLPASPRLAGLVQPSVAQAMQPDLRGTVRYIDGPHQEDPDFSIPKFIFRSVLFVICLPFLLFAWRVLIPALLMRSSSTKQVPARYIRVLDQTGNERIVKMKGEIASGNISQGDDVSFWGTWTSGTLSMHHGFNHNINTAVLLRDVITRARAQQVMVVIAIVVVLLMLLSALAGSFSF